MSDDAPTLFRLVRDSCPPAVWSRGVELTRANAVLAEPSDATDEVVYRITTRGGMFCPRVVLYPDDDDWHCECGGTPTCEHVAAAVIRWNRSGTESAAPTSAGRVGYRFSRERAGLALERVIVAEEETPLATTLAAIAAGRVQGPAFLATQRDLAVELALGTHRRGLVPPPLIERLFRELEGADDVRLDGEPIEVSAEPVMPRILLVDQDDGYRLTLEQDPALSELFANGVARCGRILRPRGEPALTGRERDELSRGRRFAREEAAELVTEVLPSLRRRLPVVVETARLPETVSGRPRIRVETERVGRLLAVLPTLVYGDPPQARVDAGRLIHLQGPVPMRDERAERNLIRRLRRQGLEPGVRSELEGAEAVAFVARLSELDAEVEGDARRQFALAPPVDPRLQLAGSRFELEFVSELPEGLPGGGRADPDEVLRAWRAGESLVPLLGGGWAPLPVDWLARFGHRVADLLAARGADGELPRCCLPSLAELCEELDEPLPPELERLRRVATSFEAIPENELPADLVTPLRSYQRRGVDWLAFLREVGMGALLADDMGLGKTLQALCAIRGRSLVVCPTSVLHNWADEIRRHRPGLRHAIYHGPKRRLDPTADVTLTTYAILRLDGPRLEDQPWETVVLDEAQNIKNPDSQVAASAFRIRAGFRIALTGTPVENRLEELWSQFHFINRGLLGGRRAFAENYADAIAAGDPDAAARLRARIRPFLLRRLKREVAAELPPRTEMVLGCELSEAEREVYESIRLATLRDVVRRLDSGGSVMAALEALLRLRQAACHRGLVPGQHADRSSKLDVLIEALENVVADGHKALAFSQWTSLLDLLEAPIREAGIDFVRLDGSTRDRAAVVRAFQDESGPPLMLISLKAGGTGLNLTAADHIFLLDPWWNPAVEDQAADRAHRIGQRRPVMVYRLVAAETVEERILELQQRKREVAAAALGGAERASALTRDDLLELLS